MSDPVFPNTRSADVGLTTREYYAAKAMQSILSHPHHYTMDKEYFDRIARLSVIASDSLIKALSDE